MTSELVLESFKALTDSLAAEAPELKDVLDQAKAGTLTEQETLHQMVSFMLRRPDLAQKFRDLARKALAPLQNTDPTPVQLGGGPMFHSGVGLPQLSPLIQGAMVERRQFDGDVPEWRTGPLSPEMLPAVPILAGGVRNPHMLGQMMHEAALRLGHQVQVRQQQLLAKAEQERALQQPEAPLPPALLGGTAETDHPQYRRGQVPEPIRAPKPTASRLEEANAQQSVWEVIATTQGRRSAAPVIQGLVLEALLKDGQQVQAGIGQGDPQVQYQWTMNLGGITQIQPGFNAIDTAARTLARALGEMSKALGSRELLLEVRPVSNLADRMVGWAGLLWLKEGA